MEYRGVCDIGLKRTINQDAVFMAAKGETGLFCVADGMGGHNHGEWASGEIVRELKDWWNHFREEDYDSEFSRMMSALNKVLEKANQDIYQMSDGQEICGSTVVLLFIHRERFGVLNVGDSRVYLCKSLKVELLTVDEVWENQIGLTLGEDERRLHPNWGKLVNAIGVAQEVGITSMTDLVRSGMVFMLCSDGVYKMLPEKQLRGYLRKSWRYPFDTIMEKMMKKVYDGGAKDNASVVLVRV